MNPGLLITLEGIEGSGKSTQASLLRDALHNARIPVSLTREPGGSPLAERVRDLILHSSEEPMAPGAELLLFLAARAQHVARTVRPALERGEVVVCDRFTDATLAYQGGGRTIPEPILTTLNDWATGGIRPARTYLLDVPVDLGLQRASTRSGERPDRLERESREFFEAVRARYLDVARREPERMVVLRGTDSQASLAHQIWEDVQRILGGHHTHGTEETVHES
ncbi:MAG TPA: dTMP kinase [Candidatus Saccharimonadales bacterium]|nr:dTMP kinase [Candidatus Saccharimonadales bacterium]